MTWRSLAPTQRNARFNSSNYLDDLFLHASLALVTATHFISFFLPVAPIFCFQTSSWCPLWCVKDGKKGTPFLPTYLALPLESRSLHTPWESNRPAREYNLVPLPSPAADGFCHFSVSASVCACM
jgi:hypothetical protein